MIGPLLLTRKHNVSAPHLIRAIAAAFYFQNPGDIGAVYVQQRIAELGIESAVRELCELIETEDDLVQAVVDVYQQLAM